MCNEMHCNSDSTTDKKDNVRSSSWDPLQWYCHPKRYVHHFQSIYQKRYMQYIIHIYRICNDRLYHEIFWYEKRQKVPAQNPFRQGDNSDASDLRSGRCGLVGWVSWLVGLVDWLVGYEVDCNGMVYRIFQLLGFSGYVGTPPPNMPRTARVGARASRVVRVLRLVREPTWCFGSDEDAFW